MKQGVIIAGSGRGSAFAQRIIREGRRRVVAIVDTNMEIHEKLRKRFDEEYGSPETAVMGSLEEALKTFPVPEADTVLIVTPNNTHAELLRLALEAGRHVLLEKPVAADMGDLGKIARLAKNTDRVIQLGFVMRYSPLWQKILEIAQSGKLGTIGMIQQNEWIDFAHSGNAYRRGWRRKLAVTGGFMNEKCSHDLDLICNMKKGQAEPVKVYSVAGTQMFPVKDTPVSCPACGDKECPFRYKAPPASNPHYQLAEKDMNRCVFHSDADIVNIQSITVTFSDGTQAIHTLIPYTGGEAHRSVFIHGTEGFLRAFQGESSCSLEVALYRESGMRLIPVPLDADAADGHGGGDAFILNDLFDCIENHRHPEATVCDGLRASLIAFAADESARKGESVDLMPKLAEIR